MKTKLSFIAILLLIATLFGSCTNTPDLPENTEPPTLDNSTDTTTETLQDPFELLRSSKEEWISYGLAAYEDGKQAANLKEFFLWRHIRQDQLPYRAFCKIDRINDIFQDLRSVFFAVHYEFCIHLTAMP